MDTSSHTPCCKSLTHKLISGLTYVLPFAVTGALLWWVFQKVNFHQMVQIIKEGCNFTFLAIMMVISMLSHVIRGIRWGIQLRDVGLPRVSVMVESVSIFGAYALNLIFPWLGEGWRCVYMSRRLKAPLTTVIGTDLGDRSSDAIVIVLLSGLTLLVAHKPLEAFFHRYHIGHDVTQIFTDPWLWAGIAVVAVLLWVANHFFCNYKIVRNAKRGIKNMWEGFVILFHLKGIGMYLVLTLGIWVCYFLQMYVCFFAFPFTKHLITDPGMAYGVIPGLVAFMFGSFSMGVPSNGGLGPWNIAVMFALSLFGIGDTEGAAFSMMVWSCQSLMLIVMGIYSAVYISIESRRRKQTTSPQ